MIDPINVVTNGILTSDAKFVIVDPLGYFVIQVEEIIEEIIPYTGGIIPFGDEEVQKKYKKVISIKVYSGKSVIFEKSVEVENIDVTLKNVKMENKGVTLELYDPKLNTTYSNTISLNIDIDS